MRILNNLGDKRISKYDYAYKEHLKQKREDSEIFIKDIRETFFNKLKPFLKIAFKYIDRSKNCDDASTVFDKYFDAKGFVASFSGDTVSQVFARALVNSS